MNFLVRQTKSTTCFVIDLMVNTFNTTPITFTNSKYQKFQFYKVTQYLSTKNDLENYARTICILFTSWHTLFDIKSNIIISCEITQKNVYPKFIDL